MPVSGIDRGIAAASGSAAFKLSATSGSYTVGSTFTLLITEDSGTVGVNAVDANLTYDKNVLQFVSLDSSATAFTTPGPATAGAGVVTISKSVLSTTLTGAQKVASVTFRAIGSAQSTPIKFASTAFVYQPNQTGYTNVWNGDTTGGTYALNAAVAASNSSSNSTSNQDPATTANHSTITAKPTSAVQIATQPASATEPEVLAPASYLVSIKITDSKNLAVKGAKVTFDNGQVQNTDASGFAGFVGVSKGQHKVTVSYSGESQTKSVTVKPSDSQSKDPQTFDVKLAGSQAATPWAAYAVIGVVAVVLLGLVTGRRKKVMVIGGAPVQGDSIVIGDMKKRNQTTFMQGSDIGDNSDEGSKKK